MLEPSLRRQRTDALSRARTVDDLAAMARRRTPRSVFEYVSGAAERETSAGRATDAFDRVEFRPHVMRDVSGVDTGDDACSGSRSASRSCSARPASPG